MLRKGISPLIAAVLLIAFTMAIAGILAIWARSFALERTGEISLQEKCIGALTVSNVNFDESTGILTFTIRNDRNINLTNMRVDITYTDKSVNYLIKDKDENVKDPLGPYDLTSVSIDTGDTTKPKEILVFSENCGRDTGSKHTF